jgi:hypothetical protein
MLGIAYGNPSGVFDCTGLYQNIFGQVKPKALIFFRLVPISQNTGESGVPLVFTYEVPDYIPVPTLQTFAQGLQVDNIAVDKNYIVGFRANGFNLIAPMILNLPIDPADRFKISTSVNGPWVNNISVPLNELKQPINNVFFIRYHVVTPSLLGCNIEITSTGAAPTNFGSGGEAVDQAINLNPNPLAFGDVYQEVPTILEVNVDAIALRSNIVYSLTGPNANKFKLGLTNIGPWFNTAEMRTYRLKNIYARKLFIKAYTQTIAALTAELNYSSGGDIVSVAPITCNSVEGIISSPQSPGDSFGNNAIGLPFTWDFALNGVGVGSNCAVYSNNVINCTVEYAFLITGPWNSILPIPVTNFTLTNKQVFFKVTPIAAGPFSWETLCSAAGTNYLMLAYDGVGI